VAEGRSDAAIPGILVVSERGAESTSGTSSACSAWLRHRRVLAGYPLAEP
jgi:hypothetical protein